ncbi:MAG: protein-glutamate O-methyltransferase CheR, partial [Candidatus Coatesbacteria bacterium]|nr:protein-glutamate O-methyltransferase CheR [Candidatus Coatesbacteria bacterium]
MDRATYDQFRTLIYDLSGISLNDNKEMLLSSRIIKRMRALRLGDVREYLECVLDDNTGSEVVQLIDAISTNVTHFYREPDHFEFLKRVVSEWAKKGKRRLRIWSAASSTGEEPYSIGMSVMDALQNYNIDVKILATDICTRVLQKAETGIYEEASLKNVSRANIQRYFNRIETPKSAPPLYEIKPLLKNMVVFRRLNIAQPPFPMTGPLDIVFCRNVMIYFD